MQNIGRHMARRRLLAWGLALLALLAAATAQAQQGLPQKPIRLVVGAPPGGANDTVARLVAQHLDLGQPVIVENKNGAAQMMFYRQELREADLGAAPGK